MISAVIEPKRRFRLSPRLPRNSYLCAHWRTKMGFLDKVKGVTGVGLNPDESYHRAFEKGVLLGDYQAAGDLFAKAAAKYEEAGQSDEVHRARANQCLYSFVVSKAIGDIGEVVRHLDAISE